MLPSPKTLSGKLILMVGTAAVSIVAATSALVAWNTKSTVEASIVEAAGQKASIAAKQVAIQLNEAVAAGNGLTGMLEGAAASGIASRANVIAMLKAVPGRYENVFGAWMVEVPGGIDGNMKATGEGVNEQSIFTPYWSKGKSGGVSLSTFKVDPQVQWYAEPLASGKGIITEPYLSQARELLTSVSYPLKRNGGWMGVAGADVNLSALSGSLDMMKPFGNGRVMLVSSNGKWLTHPDASRIMKQVEDESAVDVKAAIADGHERLLPEPIGGMRRTIHPFQVPGMATRWSIVVDVPEANFSDPVWHSVLQTGAGGLVVLALILGALWAACAVIVRRPMTAIMTTVEHMGEGRYDMPVGAIMQRRDEVGRLAGLLERFRHGLSEAHTLRREQERLQTSADMERERRSAIEHAKADDLRVFVHAVESSFDKLSAGDLTARMNEAVAAEFEPIKLKFNGSVAQLENTIGSVVGGVGSMRVGLNEITVAASDLSQRTEQQAASLEETVAALTEVVRGVDGTARSADDAEAAAAMAQMEAEKGGAIVSKAVAAMSEIEQSSNKIGSIIGVIDEIAFQTNLLALNAGVEAARAGEAGRGFAVVAQEVRGLAQRSAEAAKEIKDLIHTSSRQVEEGVALVSQSGASLQEIVGQVGSVAKVISTIATAAREQAMSLKEVSMAADQMDKVTQQNAAMVEETTAAAQSLSSETEELAAMVDGFQTGTTAQPVATQSARNNVKRSTASARPVAQMRSVGRGGTISKAVPVPDNWEDF